MAIPSQHRERATHVWSLPEKPVLYIEKMIIHRIQVTDVVELEDDQGFSATATVLPTHGLPLGKKPSWSFGAGWDYCYADERRVAASYGGWRIDRRDSVFEELQQILSTLPPGKNYLHDYTRRPVTGSPITNAVLTPGGVAKLVSVFLSSH